MMKIDPRHQACRYEFEAAWQRACAEEASPQAAASLRARAAGSEAAAAALWETLAEEGVSRPGCYLREAADVQVTGLTGLTGLTRDIDAGDPIGEAG